MKNHRESKLDGGSPQTKRKTDLVRPVRRKKVVYNTEPEQDIDEALVSPTRRAPTKTSKEKKTNLPWGRLPSLPHTVLAVVVVISFVASALIGFTDEGEIDIQAVMTERERELAERRAHDDDLSEESSSVNRQQSGDRPRLRPAAASSNPAPVLSEESEEQSGTSTATSSMTGSGTRSTPAATTNTDQVDEVNDSQEEQEDTVPQADQESDEEDSDQASEESQDQSEGTTSDE